MSAIFRNASDALIHLSKSLLENASQVPGRTGEVSEIKGVNFTLEKPLEREVGVPPRRASLAAQIAETLWVLSGRNDVEFISHYLPRAKDFSDDGVVWRAGYGPRLRSWHGVDQVAAVCQLLTADPHSRRGVINLFDPAEDFIIDTVDVPCNNWLAFQTTARDDVDELDLFVSTRSNDIIWGWSGINQFEWSVLLEIVAWVTGITPGRIHYNIASLHYYPRHQNMIEAIAKYAGTPWDAGQQPPVNKELKYISSSEDRFGLFELELETLVSYVERLHAGDIKKPDVYVIPLFQYFAGVLYEHWLKKSKVKEAITSDRDFVLKRPDALPAGVLKAIELKEEKGKVYRGSWCARGELFSILPNIARKVDRLGHPGAGDSEWDTLADLFNYLVLYRCWTMGDTEAKQFADQAARLFWYTYSDSGRALWVGQTEEGLNEDIRHLFDGFLKGAESKGGTKDLPRQEVIRQIVTQIACRRAFQEVRR